MHDILECDCEHWPSLRPDFTQLCEGNRLFALVLDFYCKSRLISEKLADFEEWPSMDYMRRPHYRSIDPEYVSRSLGNMLSHNEIEQANNFLIKKQYISIHPNNRFHASVNAGYLTAKAKELELCQ